MLILPSTEEQFGQVIAEAVALKVPVAVSENCGARDLLVRQFVNGFIFEADNAAGLGEIMTAVSSDHGLWSRLSSGATEFMAAADVLSFASGVRKLVSLDVSTYG
jgi:glycosyltransferase involved in cell wall biosynthesis